MSAAFFKNIASEFKTSLEEAENKKIGKTKNDLKDLIIKYKDSILKDAFEQLKKYREYPHGSDNATQPQHSNEMLHSQREVLPKQTDQSSPAQLQQAQSQDSEPISTSLSNKHISIYIDEFIVAYGRILKGTLGDKTYEIAIDRVIDGFEHNKSNYDGDQTLKELVGAFCTWDSDKVVIIDEPKTSPVEPQVRLTDEEVLKINKRQRDADEERSLLESEAKRQKTCAVDESEVQELHKQISVMNAKNIRLEQQLKKVTEELEALKYKHVDEHSVLEAFHKVYKQQKKRLGEAKIEAAEVNLFHMGKKFTVTGERVNSFIKTHQQPTAIRLYCEMVDVDIAKYHMPGSKGSLPDGILKMTKAEVESLSNGLRVHSDFKDMDKKDLTSAIGVAAGAARTLAKSSKDAGASKQ